MTSGTLTAVGAPENGPWIHNVGALSVGGQGGATLIPSSTTPSSSSHS